MTVQLFIPCFMDQLYPETAFHTVKVLEKAGCRVRYNTNQTCCGQPAYNAGYRDESKAVCTKFLKDFSSSDIIVSPSASCAGFIRNYYPGMFDNSSFQAQVKNLKQQVFELSDFLVNVLKVKNFGARLEGRAAYHDSCAALRECGLKTEPRQLLAEVEGLELVEMNDVETCCGFGGTFAVKFEPISVAMGDQKAQNAADTGADYLVSTDMSCLMHISGVMAHKGLGIKCMHLADVLATGWGD
ncbi:MAG: (Fe-S)-binding protein [Chitinophagaceae bacterium]|nr:(Fe-S)-binding protein [Chitinophagaceae bacterium]